MGDLKTPNFSSEINCPFLTKIQLVGSLIGSFFTQLTWIIFKLSENPIIAVNQPYQRLFSQHIQPRTLDAH